MIVARISGGLGNQMFQYAAARSLAWSRGAELCFDVSEYGLRPLHQGFELGRVFAAQIQLAGTAELRAVLGLWRHPRVRQWMSHPRWAGRGLHRYVVEPGFRYWPGLRDVPTDCYLSGYWQSARYFEPCADRIRHDFAFRMPLDRRNGELAGEIAAVPAVSVHVRRGDYVSNPRAHATHGLCPPAYYAAAMQFIRAREPDAQFFVFSDDMPWVKSHLPADFCCRFVDHNQGQDSHIDMRLMSLCRHHVVANSSFSWWGAWLSTNPGKVVVAPRRWFAIDKDDTDLIPSDWIRL